MRLRVSDPTGVVRVRWGEAGRRVLNIVFGLALFFGAVWTAVGCYDFEATWLLVRHFAPWVMGGYVIADEPGERGGVIRLLWFTCTLANRLKSRINCSPSLSLSVCLSVACSLSSDVGGFLAKEV